MYATDDIQSMAVRIQVYSDRLRSELFRQSKRRQLIRFYNRPANLAALWARIEDANRWRVNDGLVLNEME